MASFSSDSEGEQYEVSKIIDVRKRGRATEYLVKWKDFDSDEETWEPAKNLKGSEAAIRAFEEGRLVKTPSRKRSQQTQEEVTTSQRAGRNITRKTTVTKTETRTVTGTQSESSSPESSPLITRRQTTQRTEIRQTSDASKKSEKSSQRSSTPGQGILDFSELELPIVVLLTCVLFITLTFAIQQQ